MPSIVALTLCTLFVLFLLYLDHKQFPDASLALWVSTIWFLIASSKALGVWFGIGSADSDEGSPIDRYILLLLFLLSFMIIKKRNMSISEFINNNFTVFIILVFTLISISWSEIPTVSFKRWFRDVIVIFVAMVIASESDPPRALQCIFRRTIYIHIPFSIMLIHFYSDLGRLYDLTGELQWIGVCTQKNGLAYLCSISLFYFVWLFIMRSRGRDKIVVWYQKYIEILLIVISIYLFLGPNRSFTYSATSVVVFIVGVTTCAGLLFLKKLNVIMSAKIFTIFIAAVIIYGTTLPFIGHLTIVDPTEMLGRESTLTDRDSVWAALIPFAEQKPVLGYGFGAFWTNERRNSLYFPAHNGYLDTILNNGYVGLFFLAMFLISNVRKARTSMSYDIEWGAFWFSFLLIAALRNMTESVVVYLSQSTPALLLFFSAALGTRSDIDKAPNE